MTLTGPEQAAVTNSNPQGVMEKIKQYIADSFTDKIFHGNPAAICLPERWPDEKLMQDIASENRLSETVFVVKEGSSWKL